MAAPAFPPFRLRFATAATLLGMLGLAGCQTGGHQEPVRNALKDVGRNDPCPCGSEKKFKKCHGA